jgi:hypothetical protein
MKGPGMRIFQSLIIIVSAVFVLIACAGTLRHTGKAPRAGDAEGERTLRGYGFRVPVGSGVAVREESPAEDFVLYTFTRRGVDLLHAYSGNHPQFPAWFEHGTPERHMVINGLGARCLAGEKDGTFSRECLILLAEHPLPHYVHIWYDSLDAEDRERADAIISSIVGEE